MVHLVQKRITCDVVSVLIHTHTHSGRAFVYFNLTVLEDLAGADVCLGTHTVTPTLIGPEGQARGRGAV